jgi:uncharacterized protein (TIGR02266 family)
MFRESLAPRVNFEQPVALATPQQRLQGLALNLSTTGIFVRTDAVIPVATPVDLRFRLPTGEPLQARGTVVRATAKMLAGEPPGVALRFEEIDGEHAALLASFIEQRLRPSQGDRVRLRLDELSTTLRATAHEAWDNVVSLQAELPFLRLGSGVHLQASPRDRLSQGQIRWVDVVIDPQSGVPRLNVGIELQGPHPTTVDEEEDPVLSADFHNHTREHDHNLRAARRDPTLKMGLS